jgi:hypothetical protein
MDPVQQVCVVSITQNVKEGQVAEKGHYFI